MRSKVTFILLALNLLLFGYLLLSERPWSATQRIEDNRRRVLGPEAANLSAIEIAAYDSPADGGPVPSEPTRLIRLKREARGKTWSLTSPIDWPANDYAVGPILTALQFLEHETSFPVSDLERNGQTLADYGLDHPRLVVTCTPSAPETAGASTAAKPQPPLVLRIGHGTEIGNRLYILSPDGRRIHVVGPALLEALTLDLARLRSEQLLTIPVFESRALTLQSAGNSARTRLRREQDRWVFEAPITTRAARTPVELAINDLNALRVARFLPSAPAPDASGLSTPRLRITLEGNSRRETLQLGKPVAEPAAGAEAIEHYARLDDRPAVFTVAVPRHLLETLDSARHAMRERRFLDFDPDRVASLAIASPRLPELRIQKLDAAPDWQLSASGQAAPQRADPALVDNLIQRLRLLEAVAFVSDAPSDADLENLGFKLPERVITLRFDSPAGNAAAVSGVSELVLELAPPGATAPGGYARVVGQPFIYSVPPDTLDHFPVAPRVLRDRSLARLPESTRITRLVLRRAAAPEGEAPLLDYTPTSEPPSAHVATLLATVRDLRARRVERDDFPAAIPVDGVEKPWAYTLEATLDPAPPGGPFILSLAERTGGMTQLAGSKRLGLVFTLEQPVLDALWTLLYPEKK